MTIPRTPIDIGALHALLIAAESAVEDERAYTSGDGMPTYDDRRSVRMIVRDQQLARCAGMLPRLLAVYEMACLWRDGGGDYGLEMRITPDERAAWTAAADDQPVGEWVRSVANRAAKRKVDG